MYIYYKGVYLTNMTIYIPTYIVHIHTYINTYIHAYIHTYSTYIQTYVQKAHNLDGKYREFHLKGMKANTIACS